MTRVDLVALGFVLLAALLGLRKGLAGTALSVAGIVAGVVIGGRLAPSLLAGGEESPYTPVVALAGAAVGALVLETVASLLGRTVRRTLRRSPLRAFDSAGGLLLGAAAGTAVVWILGAVALHLPGETELRQGAQRSSVLRRLNELVPPTRLIRAIERVDPLPAIAGPIAPVAPPDPALTGVAAVGRAAPSVVRVVGVACGLGVSGSGWVGARELVVTAAHVVAGQEETWVEQDGSGERFEATAVAFDVRNDVAVLRVEGLDAPPLRSVAASPGRAVAILGYPGDGGLVATAGRVGPTTVVLTEDAYGQGPVARKLTSVRGRIRHGNSGGPAINARGEVETTVFAARVGSQGGFGVPSDLVVRALAGAGGPVSTGACTGG